MTSRIVPRDVAIVATNDPIVRRGEVERVGDDRFVGGDVPVAARAVGRACERCGAGGSEAGERGSPTPPP